MDVVIIEDEKPALEKLSRALDQSCFPVKIVAALSGVKEAVKWLREHPAPDLMLMDIELGDGLSPEILRQCPVTCPVIFITAYDEYFREAFECNGIDYLLKPVKREKLEAALQKYAKLKSHFTGGYRALMDYLDRPGKPVRDRILARKGNDFVPVRIQDVAWFYTEHKLVFLMDREGVRYIVDKSLSELEQEPELAQFFRVNRKFLAHINAVRKFRPFARGKIKVDLCPSPEEEVVVSQENAKAFRAWVGKD